MNQVLMSDAAQTKLRADLYANEDLMHVAGVTCFPKIDKGSGDYFFVAIVRPATHCTGVYREVVKVVGTEGNTWQIERVNEQCYRLNMDFRMGDMVYFEPHSPQMLAYAVRDGVRFSANGASFLPNGPSSSGSQTIVTV
jgi:hypothetical protein